jgi:hypothetical protein
MNGRLQGMGCYIEKEYIYIGPFINATPKGDFIQFINEHRHQLLTLCQIKLNVFILNFKNQLRTEFVLLA